MPLVENWWLAASLTATTFVMVACYFLIGKWEDNSDSFPEDPPDEEEDSLIP